MPSTCPRRPAVRPRLTVPLLALGPLLFAIGCGDGPTEPPEGDATVLFFSTLARADVGPDDSPMTCSLVGQLRIPGPLTGDVTSTVGVDYERSFAVDGLPVVRQARVNQTVSIADLGAGFVRVALGEPVVDTLLGQRADDGTYRGEWACGLGFPFSTDSLLVVAGFDTTISIAGSWLLQEPGS